MTGRLYKDLLPEYPTQDDLFKYLRSEGYTGSMEDMLFALGGANSVGGSLDDRIKALIAAGGPGNAAPPSSVTHAVYPSSMTFSGGNLASITDEVTPAATYTVSGTLAEDAVNGGYSMTEAGAGVVTVASSVWGMNVAYPSGIHLSLRFKRNATADDSAIILGGVNDFDYMGAASSGGGSPVSANIGVELLYSGGNLTATRSALWTALFADTTEKVVSIKNLNYGNTFRIFDYTGSEGAFDFEGTVLGWEVFTDWDEVDDVEAHLLGVS